MSFKSRNLRQEKFPLNLFVCQINRKFIEEIFETFTLLETKGMYYSNKEIKNRLLKLTGF